MNISLYCNITSLWYKYCHIINPSLIFLVLKYQSASSVQWKLVRFLCVWIIQSFLSKFLWWNILERVSLFVAFITSGLLNLRLHQSTCPLSSSPSFVLAYPFLYSSIRSSLLVSWPHYGARRRPAHLSSSAPALAFYLSSTFTPSPSSPSFFLSFFLRCSSSLPLPHPSLSRGLSDLPGGHHGNLHPGHPLLEPLGDPVRPP